MNEHSKEKLMGWVERDLGEPLVAAVPFRDEPSGAGAALFFLVKMLVRDRMARSLFGLRSGYLVRTQSGEVATVEWEGERAVKNALPAEGVSISSPGNGVHRVSTPGRSLTTMHFMEGGFVDEQGSFIRDPQVLQSGADMVRDLAAHLSARSAQPRAALTS